ncbi:hypothetical protein, partial [Chamaesiphon sp. OTE_75_metabat_556]|uniref:hypothetical protein n=1 Tax=Chamaesiphon sp. OTE_75_metabat_556 TaxID=2964692 RepID=UPI00286B67A6
NLKNKMNDEKVEFDPTPLFKNEKNFQVIKTNIWYDLIKSVGNILYGNTSSNELLAKFHEERLNNLLTVFKHSPRYLRGFQKFSCSEFTGQMIESNYLYKNYLTNILKYTKQTISNLIISDEVFLYKFKTDERKYKAPIHEVSLAHRFFFN